MAPVASQTSLPSLTVGLNFSTVEDLKKLLALLPVSAASTRKADLIKAIANYLLGSGIKTLWGDLDDLQQAAIAEAVHLTKGEYRPEQFQAKYGALPEWRDRSSYYRYNQPAAKLDLFFYGTSQYGQRSTLPEDLRQKLKGFVPAPEPLVLPSTDDPPSHYRSTYRAFEVGNKLRPVIKSEDISTVWRLRERVAQQELLAILRLVHLGKVAVSDKTSMPSKATLKAIAPLLAEGEYYSEADQPEDDYFDPIGAIAPFAWVMLVQGGGLASLSGKKLQLTKAGRKAMGDAPAKTLKAIWRKWSKTTLLDELRRVDAIKGQTGKGKRGLTAVSGRRSHAVSLLQQCPVGRWVAYDELKRYAIASNQTFEVSRTPDNLYISEPGYGHLYEAENSWSILQDGYLKCLLFEYLATLGFLDVTYIPPYQASRSELNNFWGADDLSFLSRYDGLVAFRITPLGAFGLGFAADYVPPTVTATNTLRVLPNLDIVMTGPPLSPAESLMMETFARQTGDAVWTLEREIILKAVEAGHALSDFYEFLQQASGDALPATVEQFFDDCRNRLESVRDRGVARLIECNDATLATLI
ncbi:MAG: hypothetical protein AAFX40_17955, partial [Cyanobacteria bacterium J06639_1]